MSRRRDRQRRRSKRGTSIRRVLMFAVLLIGGAGAITVIGAIAWVINTAASAPNLDQLHPVDPGQTTQVFAADGSSLGYIQSDNLRTEVPESAIPLLLREATVAIEDRRFYQHGGVDYMGIMRAGVRDVFGGGSKLQGGSTLTMQLVENLYLPAEITHHHDLSYKIEQAKLANQLEKHHPREWILTQYLNDVAYGTLGGETAIGVAAASELFFNKPVSRLNLPQAALLAGLPQAPSAYNPFLAPHLARTRRNLVLDAMVQSHYITPAQGAAAKRAPLEVQRNTTYQVHRQPYVFDYVRQELISRFGLQRVQKGGLKVYTTIDLARQAEARKALLANEGNPGDPAAALVSIDPSNGHILAMGTSSSYDQTSFDYATQAHRQTGSAFKVFVLMTLIHDYHGDPNSTFYASRELLPGWLPSNPTYHVQTSEHSYLGEVNLVKATALSDNTVYAQLDADVGPTNVTQIAHAMGITSHLDSLPAEGIGGLRIGVSPLEMADAYATLANGGTHYPPTAIAKVVFPNGRVVNLGNIPGTRVFTDGEAYAADQTLKSVLQYGTGTAAQYGCPASGKTGTTSNFTDAWFVGYTPQLSTSVWVGYPKSTTSMNDVNGLGPGFGGTLAAPIWRDYMKAASDGYCQDFPTPTTPFSGTPFLGHYAGVRGANTGNSGNTGNTGSGTTGATGTTGKAGKHGATGNTGAGNSGANTGAGGGTGNNGGNTGGARPKGNSGSKSGGGNTGGGASGGGGLPPGN